MNEFGVIAEVGTIRFEREFPQSADVVWEHLTKSPLLSEWLAAGEIQLHEGGYVELAFENFEGNEGNQAGYNISGVVSQCTAPRSLAYWWTDANTLSNVIFELVPRTSSVLMLLTHGGLSLARAPKSCASWHAHLDMLRALLRGDQPGSFVESFNRVAAHYEHQCAQILDRLQVRRCSSPSNADPSLH